MKVYFILCFWKESFLNKAYGSIRWMPEYKLIGINKNASYQKKQNQHLLSFLAL